MGIVTHEIESWSGRFWPTGGGLKRISGMVAALVAAGSTALGAAADSRPNFLIIMTDDQSHDTLNDQFMPITNSEIADQGITFTNGMIPTSMCCPSRTCFLTGLYARHTGVFHNTDLWKGPTFVEQLHDSGYYTGMIGKFLNSWPGDPRPEYDYWVAWIDGYLQPKMNVFGTFEYVPGYLTSIQQAHAENFLHSVPAGKPFFLLFTPHAPHQPATPAPAFFDLYHDLPLWRPPSFDPVAQADKPLWLKYSPLLTSQDILIEVDEFRRMQLASLKSVDNTVGALLKLLQSQGKLNNTFIVFYSDNGYLWGEHRLIYKDRQYEESSRVPFAIRYPPLVTTPRLEANPIMQIDLPPTILELAGLPLPWNMDGTSLVPLLKGSAPWARDGVLLEGHKGPEEYQGFRTQRYVYIETTFSSAEFYDLEMDPFEMRNQINNPAYAKEIASLRNRLHQFSAKTPGKNSEAAERSSLVERTVDYSDDVYFDQ